MTVNHRVGGSSPSSGALHSTLGSNSKHERGGVLRRPRVSFGFKATATNAPLLGVWGDRTQDVPEPRFAPNRIESRILERGGQRAIIPRAE